MWYMMGQFFSFFNFYTERWRYFIYLFELQVTWRFVDSIQVTSHFVSTLLLAVLPWFSFTLSLTHSLFPPPPLHRNQGHRGRCLQNQIQCFDLNKSMGSTIFFSKYVPSIDRIFFLACSFWNRSNCIYFARKEVTCLIKFVGNYLYSSILVRALVLRHISDLLQKKKISRFSSWFFRAFLGFLENLETPRQFVSLYY